MQEKIDINTEAFIQSAAMQMKAHNPPASVWSAPSISAPAITILIMLVSTGGTIGKKLQVALVSFSGRFVLPDDS